MKPAPASRVIFAAVLLFGGALSPAARSETTVQIAEAAPPEEVAEAVRKTLGENCHRVLEDGAPLIEIWLRSPLVLNGKPDSIEGGLDALPTATLLGVVRVHKALRDYRDDDLTEGVHTIRFGKIPSDGNHLGATEHPYFAVLIPAAKDKELDGIKTFRQMTNASAEETVSEHPMVMSLRPVKEKPASVPALTEPAPEHKSIVVSVKGKAGDDSGETELFFEVVFEGMGEI